MLAGLWDEVRVEWERRRDDPRPPVFIVVCKNTAIAKVLYEWLAENSPPTGVPAHHVAAFLNTPERVNTIRVDSKVVHETDTGHARSDDAQWMRFTLDTVGRTQCRAIGRGAKSSLVPDFIVRLEGEPSVHLIIETKGYDELAGVKAAAAERWVAAVNADGQYGEWRYAMARKVSEVRDVLDKA